MGFREVLWHEDFLEEGRAWCPGTFGKEMSYEDARFDKADSRALYIC